jgi:uncharacterized iron-regulated membrane protein
MSPAARKRIVKLHLWLGLPAAAVYLVVALTGALLVYEKDLDRAWHPDAWQVDAAAPALPLAALLPKAQAAAPGYELKEVRLDAGAGEPAEFRFHQGPHVRLDPATGAVLGTRARGDSFFGIVEKLHTSLVLGEVGKWIVASSTVILLVLLGTGLVLWWPKQWRMLKGAVTLAFDRKGRAFHFNLHNTLGFWSAVPLFAMALTGSVMAIKPLGDLMRGGAKEMRPPVAISPADAAPASLDTLALAAQQTFPGWQQLRLHAPRTMHDMDEEHGPAYGHAARQSKIENPGHGEGAATGTGTAAAVIGAKSKLAATPGDGGAWRAEAVTAGTPHEHARSRAYLDPRSAAVLRVDRFEDLPFGTRARILMRPIHDGSILGRPTQAIALLGVLMLPVLSVTGVALWWLKRRAELARQKCTAVGLIKGTSSRRPSISAPLPAKPMHAAS